VPQDQKPSDPTYNRGQSRHPWYPPFVQDGWRARTVTPESGTRSVVHGRCGRASDLSFSSPVGPSPTCPRRRGGFPVEIAWRKCAGGAPRDAPKVHHGSRLSTSPDHQQPFRVDVQRRANARPRVGKAGQAGPSAGTKREYAASPTGGQGRNTLLSSERVAVLLSPRANDPANARIMHQDAGVFRARSPPRRPAEVRRRVVNGRYAAAGGRVWLGGGGGLGVHDDRVLLVFPCRQCVPLRPSRRPPSPLPHLTTVRSGQREGPAQTNGPPGTVLPQALLPEGPWPDARRRPEDAGRLRGRSSIFASCVAHPSGPKDLSLPRRRSKRPAPSEMPQKP